MEDGARSCHSSGEPTGACSPESKSPQPSYMSREDLATQSGFMRESGSTSKTHFVTFLGYWGVSTVAFRWPDPFRKLCVPIQRCLWRFLSNDVGGTGPACPSPRLLPAVSRLLLAGTEERHAGSWSWDVCVSTPGTSSPRSWLQVPLAPRLCHLHTAGLC